MSWTIDRLKKTCRLLKQNFWKYQERKNPKKMNAYDAGNVEDSLYPTFTNKWE